MKTTALILSVALALPAAATHKPPAPPAPQPAPVVVDRHDDHAELKGAIVGALITWAILRARHKRHTPHVTACPTPVCTAPTVTCPDPSPVIERVFEACQAK